MSHPLHMMRFGVPGKTLIGSDSHTPAAGSLGMYAVGAGGADVALAMSGEPVEMAMPEVWGVELTGELPDWVSAKDVILEELALELSPRQRDLLQAGGLIDWLRSRDGEEAAGRTTKKTGTRNE